MKPAAVNALRLLLLCAAAGGAAAIGVAAAERMENRIETRVSGALAAAGHDWAGVEADGLTATITGLAPDEADRFRAMTVAGDMISPGNLNDTIEVEVPEPVAAPEYRLEILRGGHSVTLHGLVPGGPEGRQSLVSRIGEMPSVTEVSDLLSAAALAPPEAWGPTLDLALDIAGRLEDARLTLRPGAMEVSGLAANNAEARVLAQSFRESAAAANVVLTLDLRQPRPVISPFVTRFRIDGDGARFETCAAESPAGREAILAAARRAGATPAPETCAVGLGAPDPRWSAAAVTAIDAAARLDAASVTISDLSVVLVAGAGVEPQALDRVQADLERLLPEMFTLDVLAPQAASGSGDTADPAPGREIVFSATRSPEGLVQLRGPVEDSGDSDLIAAYADAMFGEDLHLSLRQQQGVPSGWPVRVMAGLEAFSAVETGSLRVTPAAVEIRGTTGNKQAGNILSQRLTVTLGEDAFFTVALTYDEALDPIASMPTPQECVDSIGAILARDKIDFAPGSTTLDGTALRVVDRIAEVLRNCPDVAIEIGGHTDSQGRAEMNERLSQARADAVFDALIGRRVRMSKLSAKGYGEERPVEGNDSPDGRDANRRIEFVLLEQDGSGDVATEAGDATAVGDAADADASPDTTAEEPEPSIEADAPPETDAGAADTAEAAPDLTATAQACVDQVNAILAEDKITFAPSSVDLDDTATGIVAAIAEVLQGCPAVEMEIGGHTDSQGRDSMNTQLSQARADAVFNALIGAGLSSDRLSSRGYGEAQPVADNGTRAGREANRRIEFTLRAPENAQEEAPTDGAD